MDIDPSPLFCCTSRVLVCSLRCFTVAQMIPVRARLHHEEDPQFPHSFLGNAFCDRIVQVCFASHGRWERRERGNGADNLWWATQALSHESLADTRGTGRTCQPEYSGH